MKRKKLLKHFAAQKHIFVCAGKSCGKKSGRAMRKSLKHELKAAGYSKNVRVMQCTCLGLCGDGVNAVVHPGTRVLIDTTLHEVLDTVLSRDVDAHHSEHHDFGSRDSDR